MHKTTSFYLMDESILCDRLSCNWLIRIKYDGKMYGDKCDPQKTKQRRLKCLEVVMRVWARARASQPNQLFVFANILCVDVESTHGDCLPSLTLSLSLPSFLSCSILRRTLNYTQTLRSWNSQVEENYSFWTMSVRTQQNFNSHQMRNI